jgi:hypothetical protein
MISLPDKKGKPEWISTLTSDLKVMALPRMLKGKKPEVGQTNATI